MSKEYKSGYEMGVAGVTLLIGDEANDEFIRGYEAGYNDFLVKIHGSNCVMEHLGLVMM